MLHKCAHYGPVAMKEPLRSYGEPTKESPCKGVQFSVTGRSGVRPGPECAKRASRSFSGVGVCNCSESRYTAIISLCLHSRKLGADQKFSRADFGLAICPLVREE